MESDKLVPKMKRKLVTAIENYKSPEEIMRFFESEMLKDGLIADRMDVLKRPDVQPKTRWLPWHAIQLLYIIFGIRAAVLFLLPILYPEYTTISLVLGDGLSSLGVAVRQMWYSLSVNYSILFASNRYVLKRAEGRRHLHFMTDFNPGWASQEQQNKLRLPLNLLFIGYSYFNYVIYATIVSTVTLSITLDTMARKSLSHLLFNLFWAGYNFVWMLFCPGLLFQLFVYTWLATKECSRWLHDTHATGQRILRHYRPNRASVKISKLIVKLRVQFYTGASEVHKYNLCLKYVLQLFRTLVIPICATDTYVLFTGTYPNLLSRFLVLSFSLNQLIVIYLFMSLAAVPYQNSLPIAEDVSSMLVRMRNELSVPQKKALFEIRKRVTNNRYPVGYTCGDVFWFSPKTMMDFLFEIGSVSILCLQMIIKI